MNDRDYEEMLAGLQRAARKAGLGIKTFCLKPITLESLIGLPSLISNAAILVVLLVRG
jgi:hypothetical protein